MGTRNLTCIVSNGEVKVAKYCQWDGYPEGQGYSLLDVLNGIDLEALRRKVDSVVPATDEDYADLDSKKNRFASLLVRDTGGGKLINSLMALGDDEKKIPILFSLDFANDSLFCEWGYVIDLDKQTLEVYEGFNQEPLSPNERFYSKNPNNGGYYPIRFVASFDLNNLPTKEKFLEEIKSN